MLSRPNFETDIKDSKARRKIIEYTFNIIHIMETYISDIYTSENIVRR